MSMASEQVWQQYANALTALLTTGSFDPKTQAISFNGISAQIDLCNPDPQIISSSVYELGNTIPAWGPAYVPKSDLVTAYALYLNSIQLKGDPNPNLDGRINIAANSLTQAQQNYNKQMAQAVDVWQIYRQLSPSTNFWDYASSQCPVYIEAYKVLIASQSHYDDLMTKKYGMGYQEIQQALNAVGFNGGARDVNNKNNYNMQIKRGTVAPAGSIPSLPGETVLPPGASLSQFYVPNYTLGGDFGRTFAEWQDKSSQDKVEIGPLHISGSSTSSDWSKFGWDASASASLFKSFFSLWAQGSASSESVTQSFESMDYDLDISFTGLGLFPVQQGIWLRLALIQQFKNSLRPGCGEFFGESGTLNLLPVHAIIGFEPKISLKLNNKSYHEYKLKWQAKATASLGIGPFRIGNASVLTYGEKENIQYDDNSQTISIGPIKSTLPLLLGVISTKL